MKNLSPLSFFIIAAVLLFPIVANAHPTSVSVLPFGATTQDELVISYGGYMPTPCNVLLRQGISIDGDTILVEVDVIDATGICIQVIEPYSGEYSIGPIAAGDYQVIFRESRVSISGFRYFSADISVVISVSKYDGVAVPGDSWSRIKSLWKH